MTIGCQPLMTMTASEQCCLGRLELTYFSIPTTSGTVSVIWMDALCNTSGLTALDSLNTCLMCERQRWIFNVPTILLWQTEPPSLGLNPKDPAIFRVRSLLKAFYQFDTAGTRSANRMIDSPSLFQLRHPDKLCLLTVIKYECMCMSYKLTSFFSV